MKRGALHLVLAAGAVVVAVTTMATSAFAQSAQVSGLVTDASGSVVPKASVTVLNKDKGLVRATESNDEGFYVVPLLQPGNYMVTVRANGFQTEIYNNVTLNVEQEARLDFKLQVGSVQQTVIVEGGAPMINSESGAVSTVIDRKFVSRLPLSGRSFQSLILLTPGIVATPVAHDTTPGEFSVNGQRQNANYFTLDGVSANIGVSTGFIGDFSQQAGGAIPGATAVGTTSSVVSIDALEEYTIQTSTYSAESGRQPGAQVQLVSRSGTNHFHGTAFNYLRNEALDAENWFNSRVKLQNPAFRKPQLRQNQFGGTFGGPIILPKLYDGHNKTFFFFSYEGQRLRLPVQTFYTAVPSLRLRQAAAAAMQPFLNAYPLPTGPEATELQDPRKPPDPVTNPYVLSGYAPFATPYSSPANVDAISIRLDHMVNRKLTLFGRYTDTPSNSLRRTLNQLTGDIFSTHTLTLGATLSVTPRLNNGFRFNYSSNRGRSSFSMDNFGGAVPLTLAQMVSGYSGPGRKEGEVGLFPVASFGLFLGDNTDSYQRQVNIVDNVSLAKRAHQLKFGIDVRRLTPIYGPREYSQSLRFSTHFGETREATLARIISGTADSLDISASRGVRPIYANFSAYAQDAWKLSPRLALDLGLRWELNPAPHDANGLKPVSVAGVTGTDVSRATLAPPESPIYKTFYTAFAPRVGVAYQLNRTHARETVLRGGFGLYYDLGSGSAVLGFSGFPFNAQSSYRSVQLPIPPAVAQPPAFTALTLPISRGITLSAVDPDLKLPLTLQWNVALQQALGTNQTVTVSYVAAAARRLLVRPFLNMGLGDLFFGPRPNPNFFWIFYATNGPTSDYQSLQVQYQRRLSRGLQALANYTWSHAIDEVSDEVTFGTLVRSNANFDVRHNFSAAFTYDVPKLSSTGPLAEPVGRFVKAIANGWSVDAIFYAHSGTPLNLSAGSPISLSDRTWLNVRPDVVPGKPFWIKDPTVPGGQRLNPAAFQLPPRGRQGTLGRNVVYVPGMYQMNMALGRQIKLTERLNLQFKAEAFNVLNHPLFGGHVTCVGCPNFGVPGRMLANNLSLGNSGNGGLNSLYQIGGPRSMQLSLRLTF